MHLSYLPPLMVYVAAGVSGLTAIVGTFFIKDYLGLSAAFLADLKGLSNKEIARQLQISHRTVEIHRSRMMHKMQADSIPELVNMAMLCGVIEQPV